MGNGFHRTFGRGIRGYEGSREARGFTFVEALLVVAVLAAIIALMLPALSKTRERMRVVSCANQLKQLGIYYGLYSSDNKGFLGGCVNWGLRDCFTSVNPIDNPGQYYERSIWGQSTTALGRYGFNRPTTLCPSRTYSRYYSKLHNFTDGPFYSFTQPQPPRLWGGSMLISGWAHNYQDYWFFAGFTNYPTIDWANEKHWGVYTGPGYHWPSELQSPTVHLRQKRSPKAVLVMDRSWSQSTSFAYYTYNDIGRISSHLGKRSKFKAAVPEAAGGNNLLLDLSVAWTPLEGVIPSYLNGYKGTVFNYGRDYYRNFIVGGNLINP